MSDMSPMIKYNNLLSVDDLTDQDIQLFFQRAAYYKSHSSDSLSGRTIFNLFFENSTRTLASFELAGKKLGGNVVTIPIAASSIHKGEDLEDTVKTLAAMRPDILIMRHGSDYAPHEMAKIIDCGIINAGDGINEHPSQALLDAFTIEQAGGVNGKNIIIIGDLKHSRVAGSGIKLLQRLGGNVIQVAPSALKRDVEGVEYTESLDQALKDADIAISLRIQKERIKDATDFEDFKISYQINNQRLQKASKSLILMHPGPVNWGVELSEEIKNSDRSQILQQVTNGVAMRQAILEWVVS